MNEVYLLAHYHNDKNLDPESNVRIIGVYSSHKLAEEAQIRAQELEGFIDYPQCFKITSHKIDEDHWTIGFIQGWY